MTDAAQNPPDLDHARKRINEVDRRFVRLLAERMELVRGIGELKGDEEGAIRDSEREARLARLWSEEAEAQGLSSYFTGRILREILSYSRRAQEPLVAAPEAAQAQRRSVRVAVMGTAHTYGALAAAKLFDTRQEAAEQVYTDSFSEAVEAVVAGDADCALLPVENSIGGSLGEVNQLLAKRPVFVVDEEVWAVEHVLAAAPGTALDAVRRVRSHPMALAQCQRLLTSMVGVITEPWGDTAGAARSVAQAPGTNGTAGLAAICSAEAAEAHGLVVLKRKVADQAHNMTRFLLLAREEQPPHRGVQAKTTVLLRTGHQPGALARCLEAFARHGVNMTRIESRPVVTAPWEYAFLIDFLGHGEDETIQEALAEVRQHSTLLRSLGSYPARTESGAAARVPAAPRSKPRPKAGAACPAVPKPSDKLPLASARQGGARTVLEVGGVEIGGPTFTLISGPCAVENRSQIFDSAEMVKAQGARLLRGGAFKPRSSPYSFQGLGFPGLDLLREAGDAYELPIVTEVLRPEDVERVAEQADVLQVGARNMQNFALLKALGQTDRAVLLKRGMSATLEELLQAAEYVMAGGNQRVILCERGIRTFETATRNTLDVSAVPVLKDLTHLPVIVDPSHAAGVRRLVLPLALAAVAAGADGLIVEAHINPDAALCDKEQALTDELLGQLVDGIRPILAAQGRSL